LQQLLDLYGQWFRSRIDLLLPTHELITPIFSGLYIRRFWAKLWQKQKVLGGFNKYLKKITMKLLRHDKLYELHVSKRFVGLLSRPGLSETDILDLCSYCLLQLWTVLCVWLPVGTGLGLFLFNIFHAHTQTSILGSTSSSVTAFIMDFIDLCLFPGSVVPESLLRKWALYRCMVEHNCIINNVSAILVKICAQGIKNLRRNWAQYIENCIMKNLWWKSVPICLNIG